MSATDLRRGELLALARRVAPSAPVYAELAQALSDEGAFLDDRAISPEKWMGGTFACAVAQHLLARHGWSEPSTVARAMCDGRAALVLQDREAVAEVAATRTMQVCDPWFGDLSASIRRRLLGQHEHDVVDLGCGAGTGLMDRSRSLRVVSRVGIDLHVPTLDPTSVRWLQSCLPVDHVSRRDALGTASVQAAEDPGLTLVEGDVLDLAEDVLNRCGSPRTVIQACGLLHALGPDGQRSLAGLVAQHMERRAASTYMGSVLLVDPDAAAVLRMLRSWSVEPPNSVIEAGRDVLRRLAVVVSWSGGRPALELAAAVERDKPEGVTIALADEHRRPRPASPARPG